MMPVDADLPTSSLRLWAQLALVALCDERGTPRFPAAVLPVINHVLTTTSCGVPLPWQQLWRLAVAEVDRHNEGFANGDLPPSRRPLQPAVPKVRFQ